MTCYTCKRATWPTLYLSTPSRQVLSTPRQAILKLLSANQIALNKCKPILLKLQSILVISKSKGLSDILRDIRTSKYQICRIKKKYIAQPYFTNEYVKKLTPETRDIENIVKKEEKLLLFFNNILLQAPYSSK